MPHDLNRFLRAVFSNWVGKMCGGLGLLFTITGLILMVLSPSDQTTPLIVAFVLIGIAGLFYAFFEAWREKDQEASTAKMALKPRLAIASITSGRTSNDHRRVVVHNLSGTVIRVGARLESIKPGIDHDVPVRLQLTNTPRPHLEADIPPAPDGRHSVDVFVEESGRNGKLGLLLATDVCVTTNMPFFIPRQRYEIRISVFPVSVSQASGSASSRSFFIIPEPDGSIIFSDAGGESA